MTILEELNIYWKSQNLPKDGGSKDFFNEAKIGKFSFKYPNLDGRALILHDINHLLTSYQTNWKGECEVSAWELASGGRRGYPTTWIYPVSLLILGLFICPIRTIKAYKNGLGKRNSFIISKETDIFKLTKSEIIERTKTKNYLPNIPLPPSGQKYFDGVFFIRVDISFRLVLHTSHFSTPLV